MDLRVRRKRYGRATAGSGGGGGGSSAWSRAAVDVSGGTIDLNMAGTQLREFTPSGAITAPKTWQVSNGGSAFQFRFRFTVDDLHVQTLTGFKMSDARWNAGTEEWTPDDIGEYQAVGHYNGTDWYVEIAGVID